MKEKHLKNIKLKLHFFFIYSAQWQNEPAAHSSAAHTHVPGPNVGLGQDSVCSPRLEVARSITVVDVDPTALRSHRLNKTT
jgi:hypothetical protein